MAIESGSTAPIDIPLVQDGQTHAPADATSTFDTKEFQRLVQQWQQQTGMLSSISVKIKHPAYRAIVAMGPAAIPSLLTELRDRPSYWFTALRELAAHDANKPSSKGDFGEVRDAWLAWGKARGLIQ